MKEDTLKKPDATNITHTSTKSNLPKWKKSDWKVKKKKKRQRIFYFGYFKLKLNNIVKF